MRLPTYGKPRIVACALEYARHIGLPRACLPEVLQLLADLKIEALVRDKRVAGRPLDATFHGRLRPEQEPAAQALLEFDTGVLAATTAFGKTVIAGWLIAQRHTNTLVIVHRKQLLEQWVERLGSFLHLPESAIGVIGGGRKAPTGGLDVAVIQSLIRKGVVDDLVAQYDQLIVDECHHIPAYSFEQVARKSKAKFVVGLSATPVRKDGHYPIIFMQCGPVRYRVDPPLADLFARATAMELKPCGTRGARSASEEFLHGRLETLSETKGRFQLNAVLPIPFDGRGTMEVDFLCREAAVVVEIDGEQHFADAEAYRRDRRKDYLLRENGPEGTVKHAQFSLQGNVFMAMDSHLEHPFSFNEALSFVVECETQEEVDYFWRRLPEGGEIQQCGWLKDRYGVSWQVVSKSLFEMLGDHESPRTRRVTEAMLRMKKLDMEGLKKAYTVESDDP